MGPLLGDVVKVGACVGCITSVGEDVVGAFEGVSLDSTEGGALGKVDGYCDGSKD